MHDDPIFTYPHAGQGAAIVALFLEHVGEVEIRLDVVGLPREAGLEGATRLGALALVVPDGAQVAVGVRIVGLELERRLVGLDRLRRATGCGDE